MKRIDDFESRREKLKKLSDEELYNRFWKLAEDIVNPLIELAKTHTSPAIERSVLLRMGFSSLEAEAIVKEGIKWGLMGKGLGNVVITYGEIEEIDYKEAGYRLSKGIGWKEVNNRMRGEVSAKG